MLQLTQKLNSGEMIVQEVPTPILNNGMVLVKNHYSLISSGTEGSTVQTARKSLIGKAKERPQQVKQVLEVLAQQGPVQTYRAVTKKLEAYSPLGYSSAGEVIAVADDVTELQIGDRVACAGVGYANHAQIISVPVNLCVKLQDSADLKKAAYNTLGAIAMQSIRQADLRLGESCAVIGLGLLGQLTCLMLKASGVRVIGIDINEEAVKLAEKHCTDIALARNESGIKDKINFFTNGIGTDAVIIAAASSSTDPVNFAGAISRKKGKVIILGAVPTGFERDPHWYKKELELKMSCSYGPGRYDINYEEKGIDYPVSYVRWTEKRNMEAFQHLMANNKIDIEYLTTHEFNFIDAVKAYDMIVEKSQPYIGIILKYDTEKRHDKESKLFVNKNLPVSKIDVAFIGAGSYAQSNLLPNLPSDIVKRAVMTNSGTTSKRVAERFGFEFCTSNEKDVFENNNINTVFITTRHDSHAEYVIKSLKSNKNIFVEKPICINNQELDKIIEAKLAAPETNLLVGFNRRYSVLSGTLKNKLGGSGPMSVIYRINAGSIPANSWIQDMTIGGGRIIGEACHFIDYLTWLNGSLPATVYASALPDPDNKNDIVNINITFENGSTGVIGYYSNGSKLMPKEYIEVFCSGTSAVLDNFKELRVFGNDKFKTKLFNQDKGQKQMMQKYFDSLRNGKTLIPFNEIVAVTKASFAVLESIKTGLPINI